MIFVKKKLLENLKILLLEDLKILLWVREVYNPAQALSGPRAHAEEVLCRGRIINGRGAKGNGCETTLSSAFQSFNGKTYILVGAIPKQPPEGDVSGRGAHRGAGRRIESRKTRPLRIKCTCQRPDPINEKRRLDGVNFDLRN